MYFRKIITILKNHIDVEPGIYNYCRSFSHQNLPKAKCLYFIKNILLMIKRIIFTWMLAMGLITTHAQTQTVSKRDTLTIFRDKIDQLDKEIVHLLGERMEAARAIGTYKLTHNIGVVQSNRFNEVLQQAITYGKEKGLSEEFIKALYEDIHKESIRQQEALKQR